VNPHVVPFVTGTREAYNQSFFSKVKQLVFSETNHRIRQVCHSLVCFLIIFICYLIFLRFLFYVFNLVPFILSFIFTLSVIYVVVVRSGISAPTIQLVDDDIDADLCGRYQHSAQLVIFRLPGHAEQSDA
jgi:hypothetical protein